ncbi:MAG: helix-hairpin-helix domain-containing protein [Chloroflexota bacterium]
MLKRLLYIGLGFAVGYLIDTIRRQQAGEFIDDVSAANMEEIYVAPAKTKTIEASIEETDVIQATEKPNADFLMQIKGIGPTYANRLFEGDIRSLQSLVDAGTEQIVEIAKLRNAAQAEEWVSQANQLLAK